MSTSSLQSSLQYQTLDEAINENIRRLGPGHSAIEYLLDALPYIAEYHSAENAVAGPTKRDAFERYMLDVEGVQLRPTKSATATAAATAVRTRYDCARCGGCMLLVPREADAVCEACGTCTRSLNDIEDQRVRGSAVYKRSNHFADCLMALQGRGTDVPPNVVDEVRTEFRKNRVVRAMDITHTAVRKYLKKLGYSAYYDAAHSIARIISGVPAPELSRDLEEQFTKMFMEIQDPFRKHKPEKRKNFLSYNYILYKFSELLGEDDLLPHFPLLKCARNLRQQDVVWKKICEDLRWQFIPSV